MMRPVTSVGGVLQVGVQEQLHEKVRGVGFKTHAQQSHALGKIVKPFQSLLVGGATANAVSSASNAAAPRRAASHKSASRRSSSAARPSSAGPDASSSHKKAGASTSSSASRPATAGAAAAALPEPQVPVWAATAVHAPDRPNAPSQQTPAERLAAHRAPGSTGTGAGTGAVPRVAKSHKLVTRQYGKSYTDASPRQLDESHAQVSIERHARPLVIRPADRAESPVIKFVPIRHVVGVRPVQTPHTHTQTQQRAWGPQPPVAADEEQEERDLQKEQAQAQSQAQQRALEQYQQQLQQSQQLQQQLLQQQQQSYTEHKLPSASAPPLSASLTTPYFDSLAGAPHPYSNMFQQQHASAQPPAMYAHAHAHTHAQSRSHSRRPSSSAVAGALDHPALSVHTADPDSADGAATLPVYPASHTAHSAMEALSSPSPVRNHHPQPAHSQQHQQQHSDLGDSHIPADAAPSSPTQRRSGSGSDLHSPAHRAEQERKRAEAVHEKQMKLYLSPSSRASYRQSVQSPNARARAGAAVATPHFTPNPQSHDGAAPAHSAHDSSAPTAAAGAAADHGPAQSVSHSSSRSSLFFETPQTRPDDLPPLPVVHAPPKLLYPPTESDPHRALAAALRGPRLQYQSSAGSVPVETPLSPQGACTAGSDAADAATAEVTSALSAVVAERAAQRAQLERDQKALWADKFNKLRQATAAAPARGMRSPPSSSPAAPISSPAAAAAAVLHDDHEHGAPARALQFGHAPAEDATRGHEEEEPFSHSYLASTTVPNVHAAGPAIAATQQGALYGGRTSDPQVVSRAGVSASRAPAAAASNVLYSAAAATAAASSTSATAAAAPSTAAPAASNSPSSALPATRRFVVGSTNGAKLSSVRDVVERVFGTASVAPDAGSIHPDAPALRGVKAGQAWRPAEVVGVNVASGVSDQPLSAQETLAGAEQRARAALASDPLAEFGVGIEGGVEQLAGRFYESGWVVIVDRHGRVGSGSSARFQLAESVRVTPRGAKKTNKKKLLCCARGTE